MAGRKFAPLCAALLLGACNSHAPTPAAKALDAQHVPVAEDEALAGAASSGRDAVDPFLVAAPSANARRRADDGALQPYPQGAQEGAYPAKGAPVPDAVEKATWEAGMAHRDDPQHVQAATRDRAAAPAPVLHSE